MNDLKEFCHSFALRRLVSLPTTERTQADLNRLTVWLMQFSSEYARFLWNRIEVLNERIDLDDFSLRHNPDNI